MSGRSLTEPLSSPPAGDLRCPGQSHSPERRAAYLGHPYTEECEWEDGAGLGGGFRVRGELKG